MVKKGLEVDILKNFFSTDYKSDVCKIAICQIQNRLSLHENLKKLQKIFLDLDGSDVKVIILPPQIFFLPYFRERYNLLNLLNLVQKVVQKIPVLIHCFGRDAFLISQNKIVKLCSCSNFKSKFKSKIQIIPLDEIIGCKIDFCIESIPFYLDNFESKYNHFSKHCFLSRRPMIYLNKFGGEEELIFDGHSCVIGSNGDILYKMPGWKECISIISINNKDGKISFLDNKENSDVSLPTIDDENIYNSLLFGVRDYFINNDLKKAVIGLSGGIDSSLVAVIAVDALGKENVVGVYLPSKFNSDLSKKCIDDLVENLGIELIEYPINDLVDCVHKTFLENNSCNRNTKHNIQARIRSLILMSYANQNDCIVLSTSNKTEITLGYVTLYGDMSGGYAPLRDIYKTQVYDLVHWRNDNLSSFGKGCDLDIFSDELIYRQPTSELEENCLDSDDLGDYDILDIILGYLLHGSALPNKLLNSPLIQQITNTILKNRFKRFQLPPGPILYSKESKHYPICN